MKRGRQDEGSTPKTRRRMRSAIEAALSVDAASLQVMRGEPEIAYEG